MHERLKKHHALEDDIADLIGGELSPRNFGAALKETIGVARDSLPDAMPPGGARAFIMLKGNEMDALVDGIVSGIAGKDSGRYLG